MQQLLAELAFPIDRFSFWEYIAYRNVGLFAVLQDLSPGLVVAERGQSASGLCTDFRRKLTGSLPPAFTTIESWAINDDLPFRRLTLPKQQVITGGRGTTPNRSLSIRRGQARIFFLAFSSQL